MPKEEISVRGNADGIRVFNAEGFLFHYTHVESGASDFGCGFCHSGFSALVTEYESKVPETNMVPGGGTDEKGYSASSPNSWWDSEGDKG